MHDSLLGKLVGFAVYTEGLWRLNLHDDAPFGGLDEPSDVIGVVYGAPSAGYVTEPVFDPERLVQPVIGNPSGWVGIVQPESSVPPYLTGTRAADGHGTLWRW